MTALKAQWWQRFVWRSVFWLGWADGKPWPGYVHGNNDKESSCR